MHLQIQIVRVLASQARNGLLALTLALEPVAVGAIDRAALQLQRILIDLLALLQQRRVALRRGGRGGLARGGR